VLDLDSGAVVFVGDGKGADALNPFWKRLRASHAKIKAVATDMGLPYIQAVRTTAFYQQYGYCGRQRFELGSPQTSLNLFGPGITITQKSGPLTFELNGGSSWSNVSIDHERHRRCAGDECLVAAVFKVLLPELPFHRFSERDKILHPGPAILGVSQDVLGIVLPGGNLAAFFSASVRARDTWLSPGDQARKK
jgi:hypothetical protein